MLRARLPVLEDRDGDAGIQASADHEAGNGREYPRNVDAHESIEEARTAAKLMYHDDRILRVMVVTDSVGSFVEWIER